MSQLIVFDMEWNMGYQPKRFTYHGAEQVLRGEIIQIGAVKMVGQEIRDTFQVTLRPRIFKKLHHQVARVTGLTRQDLDAGLPVAEGLQKFRSWCGENAVLGEWGMDDVPVLKQNLFLTGQDESWPDRWYDLQKVYLSQCPRGEEGAMGLEHMVERLGIEKNMAFHDALADALYTAKILQCVDLEQGLADYPDDETQLRELLCPADKHRCDFVSWKGFVDGETWQTDDRIRTAVCPDCGRLLTPNEKDLWLHRGKNCLYSLRRCDRHGPVMIWLRRSHSDGLHYRFARATEKADELTLTRWEKDKRAAIQRARCQQKNSVKAPRRIGNKG